jgi:predicted phosphodiesterase
MGKREEEEMEFQDAKRALKAVYGNSDSESSGNERRKTLHIMVRGLLGHDVSARRQDPTP